MILYKNPKNKLAPFEVAVFGGQYLKNFAAAKFLEIFRNIFNEYFEIFKNRRVFKIYFEIFFKIKKKKN